MLREEEGIHLLLLGNPMLVSMLRELIIKIVLSVVEELQVSNDSHQLDYLLSLIHISEPTRPY